MPKVRSRVMDRVAYVAARAAAWCIQRAPIRQTHEGARVLSRIAHFVDRRHRLVASENLRHAFPDLPQTEIARRVRAAFDHLFAVSIESVVLQGRMRADNVDEFVRQSESDDIRRAWELIRSDRPTILLTGHLGNWELFCGVLGSKGAKASFIARRLDNPLLDRYVRGLREAGGIRIIDKRGAAREAAAVLAAGGNLGLVGDQDAGAGGVFVDFFGRPASTFKLTAKLALRFAAPIVVAVCVRDGRPLRYELKIEDIIDPKEFESRSDAVLAITRRYSNALERAVRRNPDQYFWLHRRWKHQPTEGEGLKREAA